MADVRKEAKEALQRDFGFDEFMAGQIFESLRTRGLIVTETLGDSIGTVLQTLEDHGLELSEVHAVVEAMQNAGVVFRER